jgi:hypothetical protein
MLWINPLLPLEINAVIYSQQVMLTQKKCCYVPSEGYAARPPLGATVHCRFKFELAGSGVTACCRQLRSLCCDSNYKGMKNGYYNPHPTILPTRTVLRAGEP